MADSEKSDETEITTGDGNIRRMSVFQSDDQDRSVLHVISQLTGAAPPKVHLPEDAREGAPTPMIIGGRAKKGKMLDIPMEDE